MPKSDGLAVEIAAKQIELCEAKIEEFDIEGVLSFTRNALQNAATLWQLFEPAQKERFQKVVFPEGLTFLDGKFGTSATNVIFNYLRDEGAEKEEMATRHGFEP